MITLKLPSDHPNQSIVQRWATDKEGLINNQGVQLKQLQGILKTILTNNPGLGKPK